MRAALLALVALLGACGSPQTTTAHVIESKPGDTTTGAPTTPPPEVTLDDHGFRTPGLPAISADGKLVVLGEIESDPRGFPNLRVVSRDRNDAVVESITVLKPSEGDKAMGPGWRNPKLDARISAANNWLAKLHTTKTLITLPQLTIDATDGYTQHAASSGPTFLDWQKDVVTIKQSGKVVTTHPSPLTWHATETGKCTNPSKLGGAWVDVERKLALVQIAYNGTDTCWEPSSQNHVISW